MKWKKKYLLNQYEILFQIASRRSKGRKSSRGNIKNNFFAKLFEPALVRTQAERKQLALKTAAVSKKTTKQLRKLFEHKRIRQVLGVNLLSAVVLLSQISTPASALQVYSEPEIIALAVAETDTEKVETKTEIGFQPPLENFRISQGYHMFHLAVDLAAPIGSSIKPIAGGVIERIEFGRWGYGNNVLIDHGSNLKSFYAHMGKIKVKNGNEVTIGDEIGTVGMSGRSNGPHLHLEIWQNDRPLNPRVVLDLKPASNLAKVQE